MKPHHVNESSRRGRALVAAVASLLGLQSLPTLPRFAYVAADTDGDLGPLWTELDRLCRDRGLGLAMMPDGSPPPLGLALAVYAPSWRNKAERHAVVLYDGATSHDPDPSTRYPRKEPVLYVLVPIVAPAVAPAAAEPGMSRCAFCGDPVVRPQHALCSRHWHLLPSVHRKAIRAAHEELPDGAPSLGPAGQALADAVRGAVAWLREEQGRSSHRFAATHRRGAWTPTRSIDHQGDKRRERRASRIYHPEGGDE